jgi:hypothetical protein
MTEDSERTNAMPIRAQAEKIGVEATLKPVSGEATRNALVSGKRRGVFVCGVGGAAEAVAARLPKHRSYQSPGYVPGAVP